MGYDLHITRRPDWPEPGPSITPDEWMAVVSADPELQIAGHINRRLADQSVVQAPLTAWTAHSSYSESNPGPALELWGGNVNAKNPDREFRRKMWRLAQALNAKIQGDDGEFYDCFGNPARDASTTQNYWLALMRHLGFKLIWGDPVGS